jgi:hypothetical protein
MADPAANRWYAAYQAAVLGTGPGPPGSRIAEALSAIRARLDSPPTVDDAEYNEIQDAVLVVQALKAEISPD